jgi:tRNA threonylcarbamoyl adenosine modification protein (Sua5/YciO/YrdC/YwlC family)
VWAVAEFFKLHAESPQLRITEKIVAALQKGAVMLYPTDTVYAIGCDLNSKTAVQRVRQIKQISNNKPLTFLCPSLSNIAKYAQVSDPAYRLMRSLVPGPFTFILPATKLVPQLVMSPKRKTTGIRVPDRAIAQALLATLGNPIISTSANLQEDQDAEPNLKFSQIELFDHLENLVDLIIDDGSEPTYEVSTIVDLTEASPQILRQGLGQLNW